MTNTVKKFTVKRSQWHRGKGGLNSRLLREQDDKMCCLGFLSLAAGLKEDDLYDVSYLCELGDKEVLKADDAAIPELMQALVGVNNPEHSVPYLKDTLDCRYIAQTNDDRDLNDIDRERKLTEKFAAIGIEVTFVD